MSCIEARGLRKTFGANVALGGIDFRVEQGRVAGLIGPNGAGKTTVLHAILGLVPYQGELKVLGRDPWTQREELAAEVASIADVAVLPRCLQVWQAIDHLAGLDPRFDRAKAEALLAKTKIRRTSKVKELSKEMLTQLHLALVMAIDAKLLVLDEPAFWDALLNDDFDPRRTILIAAQEVNEILTDVIFLDRGRIVVTEGAAA